ncbi:MAG: succinylglutamate desuccinylase/aspartoacylase family protein [Pedobacter sp.]|nr:succinylglutamate desuccinylase/aspartoacylase family protein [Pedobacter sp.]
MDVRAILANYDNFKAQQLKNRFLKHNDVVSLLEKLPSTFEVQKLGNSFEGKRINAVKWGKGKIKILLWSQMHGDEATGTMALFDLFNFLQRDTALAQQCQLYIIPLLNPDGAERFTRRNAQQIDINRDFLQCLTPEAQILKAYRNKINPDFCFTLHDQITLWSVTGSLKPATLSFLSPAIDHQLSTNPIREKAMLVIADMFETLSPIIPGCIGLFDDEYEPRAFGDNFQKLGTSTILIEAGGLKKDPEKQEIRKFYFAAMLKGIMSIATKSYLKKNTSHYFAIPKNNKQIFHILIHGLVMDGIKTSIGINYDEYPTHDGMRTEKIYSIQDIGDLSFCDAYETFSSSNFISNGVIIFNQNAHFELFDESEMILCFQNGKLF